MFAEVYRLNLKQLYKGDSFLLIEKVLALLCLLVSYFPSCTGSATLNTCNDDPNLHVHTQVGCVVTVLDHALDVLIVELGLVRRVYTDRLNIASFATRRLNTINYLDLGKLTILRRCARLSGSADDCEAAVLDSQEFLGTLPRRMARY
jgi:hypothetical protein